MFSYSTDTIIYHYCSIDSFLSIIQNRCLWLTDAAYTNDLKEMHMMDEVFYSALEDESYAYEIMPLLRGEEVFLNRLEALVQNDALTEAEEQLRQFVENRYSGSDQSSFSYDYYKSEYQTMLAPDLSEKDLLMKMIQIILHPEKLWIFFIKQLYKNSFHN